MYRIVLLSVTLFLVTIIGCGPPRSSRPNTSNTGRVTWPALEEFSSDDVQQNLAAPANEKKWKTVAKNLKSTEFKAAFEKFDAAEIPSSYQSEERIDACDSLKAKFKALIEEAEGKADPKKIEALYSEIGPLWKAVRKK